MPSGTEMLPLIVGQKADAQVPATIPVEEAEVVDGDPTK
jgi:hypothetical protein